MEQQRKEGDVEREADDAVAKQSVPQGRADV
jgi:hypothetical protein